MGRSDNAVWASELIASRLDLPPLPEPELQERLYETRAVEPSHALPTRWPFALSEDGSGSTDPSHAAPVGACDGERTRHGDDGLERRRSLLRLRQRPPERPLRLPLRQRDPCSPGRSSMSATSNAGDRLARLRAVPARGRGLRSDLRAGRRDLRQDAAATSTPIRRVHAARPAVRRPHRDAAEYGRQPEATANRPVLPVSVVRETQQNHQKMR